MEKEKIEITMTITIDEANGLQISGERLWHNGSTRLGKNIRPEIMESLQYPLTLVLGEVNSLADSLITLKN